MIGLEELLKRCARCGGWKQLDDFHRDKRSADGRNSWCRLCHSRYDRERNYGLSAEDVQQMLKNQGYRCAIKGEPITEESCRVEHEHGHCPDGRACKKCVRGLTCSGCNNKMAARDDPEFMYKSNLYMVDFAARCGGACV